MDELRAILIVEADLKFLNKRFIVVRMVNMLQKVKVIPMDQYEGCKWHSKIQECINKNLLFGVRRVRGWATGIMYADTHT